MQDSFIANVQCHLSSRWQPSSSMYVDCCGLHRWHFFVYALFVTGLLVKKLSEQGLLCRHPCSHIGIRVAPIC